MATDAFVVMFLTPGWLVFFVFCLAIAAGIWAAALGSRFGDVRFAPLAIGISFFILGCLLLSFLSAWETFSGRQEQGVVAAKTFWQIVPGWTIYVLAIYTTIGPPVIALTLVPLAAILVRKRLFDWICVPVALIAIWLIGALLDWAQPMNIWEEGHRLEALLRNLAGWAPTIIGLGGAFFLGVGLGLAWRRGHQLPPAPEDAQPAD